MTVAEFIAARLDDLEDRYSGDRGWADGGRTCYECGTNQDEVLRQVTAMRAILALHEPVPFWGNNPPPRAQQTAENVRAWYCECQCPDGVIEGEYPCDTARILAGIWANHPDYRQEWK